MDNCFIESLMFWNVFLDLLLVGVDPVIEVGHLGVDTGVVSESATAAPGDDTVLDSAGTSTSEEWAARVTLAGVNAT